MNTFIPIVLVLCMAFTSCMSTTTLHSLPEGADVYADGNYLGKTPATYSSEKVVLSKTQLRFEKEGYETLFTYIRRSDEFNAGACIGAFFVTIPVLWILDYSDQYTFQLKTKSAEEASPSNTGDMAEELRELKKLYDEGILSKDEYEKKKEEILGRY